MTPTPPIGAIEPAGRDTAMRLDVYAPGTNQAESLFANPEQIGRAVMEAMDGFQSRVSRMQDIAQEMVTGSTPGSAAAPSASLSTTPSPAVNAAANPAAPSASPAVQGLQKEQQHMMGVMMETYDFALESSLVTRAATTFTSSVNTLIKAQ